MAFSFVDSVSGDTSIAFSSNAAGDTLVVVFAATALTNSFSTPPATLIDSAGNVWNQLTGVANFPGSGSGLYNAQFLYALNDCVASVGVNTLDMPSELLPANVVQTWSIGWEFLPPSASPVYINQHAFVNGQSSLSIEIAISPGADTLILVGGFQSTKSVPSMVDGPIAYPLSSYSNAEAWPNPNYTGSVSWTNFDGSTLDYFLNTGNVTDSIVDVFGFAFALYVLDVPPPPPPGGNAQKLVFSINKGPLPIVPKEGRAIATVQIDCTQQVVIPGAIDYPEYSLNPDDFANAGFTEFAPVGFVVCEFDLEHLFQGSGLSEVRTLTAWARPWFNFLNGKRRDEGFVVSPIDPSGTLLTAFPALLTNKITLQSISLGESAALNDLGAQAYGQYTVMPFPGNQNGLKYRFISPQAFLNNPIGKYTLQFMNFEVMGAYASYSAMMASYAGE